MDSLPRETPLDLQQYRTYLLVLARAHDGLAGEEASDLVQKTLLVAHTQQHQLRGQTPGEMAAWLKQILRNQLIDAYRQQRRLRRDVTREVPLEAGIDGSFSRAEGWAAVHSTPSQHVSREEELLRMAAALEKLPSSQREAIVLHHLQGATLAQVAQQLDRTEGAVAGLLHRGLKALRAALEEN